jgi:ribulose-phosphate 3-epimerase
MTADRRRTLLLERRVAPSILSADFGRLGEQVQTVLDAGARVIHVDVMDGHFVPPITFGAVAVEAIADRVHEIGGVVDVHMMVERPERHVEDIARAGADNITVHVEATPHLHYTLQRIRELGCSAGAAICPSTPIEALSEVARETLDLALCMTVNPGWGGQKFIPGSIDKIDRLRRLLSEESPLAGEIALEVDGGIHQDTAETVVHAGANLLVAGSAVFASGDPAATYESIVEAAGAI